MRQRSFYIQVIVSSNLGRHFDDVKQITVMVSSLFTFNLPPVDSKHPRKLIIEFLEGDEPGYINLKEMDQNILIFRMGFNLTSYSNSRTTNANLEILVGCVYRCLLTLYRQLGLKSSDVELAYTNITANSFNLSVPLCGGAKLNGTKTNTAAVTAHHHLEYALLEVTFSDPKGNRAPKTIELFRTVPAHFIYTQLVNSTKWLDNETFAISNNTKEFTLTINKDFICTSTYAPRSREKEGIIEEIRFLTKDVLITL